MAQQNHTVRVEKAISLDEFKREVLEDFRLARMSRECSVLARGEVLTGKAKFGIFGDGKEIAQLAMAKQFREGDWRSGYYRDQTFMMAAGIVTPEEFFYQLYGDTNTEHNPGNSGRSFNNHFSTANVDSSGQWLNLTKQKNAAADLSPTAAQMPRLVGLGYASKLFRHNKELHSYEKLSRKGNEVAFGMIGDASTAEGHFFETINAAGVLQIPVAVAVWDDGYGISVTRDYQVTKERISEALEGFRRTVKEPGIEIYTGKGWDYPGLCKMFEEGIALCRKEHVPVLFHVEEITQPLGHSTSGSHERYKSKERLEWEAEYDPLKKMREWILETGIAGAGELDRYEEKGKKQARDAKNTAWERYTSAIKKQRESLLKIIGNKSCICKKDRIDKISVLTGNLERVANPIRKDNLSTARKILRGICLDCPQRGELQSRLSDWIDEASEDAYDRYSTFLYNEYETSALNIRQVKPVYGSNGDEVPGREILRDNFHYLVENDPRVFIFGEDVGKIGGVNQTYEGIQKKFGASRISDTGIRETTIIGQGIGMALRGLRPIAEIQYLDYVLYALQTMSDDLASLSWRTKGRQIAPLIITTRGHRFEGIWHAGSPIGMLLGAIRGIYVCVPRNMTQAAGMYNTLIRSDDPAIVIEPLNAYRLREPRPENMGEFTVPLGEPEIIREGTDLTLVTYGSCVRIAQEAVSQLEEFDISVELIDVQTLLPFDLDHSIETSLRKTHKVVFFDEDVPGGGTTYMMHKVLEEEGAFFHLDSEPRTLTAREHRPAYATDGDYFSNPNAENVFEMVYDLMHEYDPAKYPSMY